MPGLVPGIHVLTVRSNVRFRGHPDEAKIETEQEEDEMDDGAATADLRCFDKACPQQRHRHRRDRDRTKCPMTRRTRLPEICEPGKIEASDSHLAAGLFAASRANRSARKRALMLLCSNALFVRKVIGPRLVYQPLAVASPRTAPD